MKTTTTFRFLVSALTVFSLFGTLVSRAGAQETAPPADAATALTPGTEEPANPEPAPDAVTGATERGGRVLQPKFFGMDVPVNVHRFSGYASGGLFAAAGIVGVVRYFDLKDRGHKFRTEDEFEDDECGGIIQNVWADGQWLRWTHVGLIVSGESLYLFDGITGLSLIPPDGSGTRAGLIHRTAFFVHAGLMAAEVVLGFLETDALSRGDHEMINAYGAAHAVIGVAIPVVIIGSGLTIDLFPGLKE
ncbi:MAG: hypothetical protein NT080_03860 [Spirochaetes bacterium]|nr:hypothetical protein [Spirochaetota bacterium]